MEVLDILNHANSFVGDSSTDRITSAERFQAVTEATAWLLEELGNEHMVDRAEIEYLPSVTWYKMDFLTPYLLTAGELRLKRNGEGIDFTRVDARELAATSANKYAYAIERYNDDAYLGIVVPTTAKGGVKDLVPFNSGDQYTYTGINATNIKKLENYVEFDMTATGVASTGLNTTTEPIDLTNYTNDGVYVFEVEIPDLTDVTSVALRFGSNLTTDYFQGVVNQDVGGNTLTQGLNVIKIKHSELTVVGSPNIANVTLWRAVVNHATSKPVAEGFRLSDLRVTRPIDMQFKYVFYRVGKNASGVDIIEFENNTDVPFFANRYPQYKFAVAHKTASVMFRFLQQEDKVRSEAREAQAALDRHRKNFQGERDGTNSAFRPAGINLRRHRIIRRR